MRLIKIIIAGLQDRLVIRFSRNGNWFYKTKRDKSKRNNLGRKR